MRLSIPSYHRTDKMSNKLAKLREAQKSKALSSVNFSPDQFLELLNYQPISTEGALASDLAINKVYLQFNWKLRCNAM